MNAESGLSFTKISDYYVITDMRTKKELFITTDGRLIGRLPEIFKLLNLSPARSIHAIHADWARRKLGYLKATHCRGICFYRHDLKEFVTFLTSKYNITSATIKRFWKFIDDALTAVMEHDGHPTTPINNTQSTTEQLEYRIKQLEATVELLLNAHPELKSVEEPCEIIDDDTVIGYVVAFPYRNANGVITVDIDYMSPEEALLYEPTDVSGYDVTSELLCSKHDILQMIQRLQLKNNYATQLNGKLMEFPNIERYKSFITAFKYKMDNLTNKNRHAIDDAASTSTLEDL